MKVKERESWTSYNVGKGGKRPRIDEYNKALKGQERNPQAKEYASQGLEEYHHYSERAEYKEEKDDKKQQADNQQKKRSQSTKNIAKNVVGRVVGVVVGAIVIVATYQTIQEHERAKETPVIDKVTWQWNDDHTEASAEFYDANGNLIKASVSNITVTKNEPTCSKEGSYVYTATIIDGDNEYKDVKEEVIPKISHDFDEGHIEVLEDGTMVITYECKSCHEEFSVEISANEE